MSILWLDGFDYYGSSCTPAVRYAIGAGGSGQFATGRLGGKAIQGGFTALHFIDTARSTVSSGFAYKCTSFPGTNRAIYEWCDSGGSAVCTLAVNNLGQLLLYRGGTGGTLLGTSTSAIPSSAWQYIEVEFTRHASAGACNVYVNSRQILALTGVNTGAADIVLMGFAALNVADFVDDYYVVSGATKLGEQRVVTIRPSADTAQKDFTPDSGTDNYARVNESPVNGDTSYVTANTGDSEDLYTMDDLGVTPSSIAAVQAVVIARKDDAADRGIQTIIHGSTDTGGIVQGLSTSYEAVVDLYEENPETSAAWAASDVNGLEAGMKLVA
jgi:hypothetical protein